MADNTPRRFVIFDTEYTTWDGARDRDWTGTTPAGMPEHREIVQIGALKIEWPSGRVLDTFDQLIKPTRNPDLSAYFIDLTGITQQQVDDRGVAFPNALEKFLAFVGADGLLCSYGNDIAIFGENIALNRCPTQSLYRTCSAVGIDYYINAAAPETQDIVSGALAQHFNLTDRIPPGNEHNALYDCYSILVTLQHLRARGAFLPL